MYRGDAPGTFEAIPIRKPPHPQTRSRHVRLTIGFYPEEMEAIRKATDNPSAFIREAAVAKAKRAK